MGASMTVSRSSSIGGISFSEAKSLSGNAMILQEVSVPKAETGELTLRTGNTEGTVTLDSSAHAIEAADLVDVYWDAGCRRSMVAGTIAGASVPLSGGAGDNLPTQGEDVILAVAQEFDLAVLGTNVKAISLHSVARGQMAFHDAGGEEWAVELGAGENKTWHEDMKSEDNPITGDTITKVLVSHVGTAAQTMKIGILYDND